MQVLNIVTDLTDHEACRDWPKFNAKEVIEIRDGIRVGRMPMATLEGNSSVMFMAPIPGTTKTVCLELTMQNFELLAAVMHSAEERAKGN